MNNILAAVEKNDIEEVQALISQGFDVNAKKQGVSALMVASFNNATILIDLLLHFGADPNASDKYGTTPLMFASMHGYTLVVEHLLKYGAEVDKQDKKGWTALMHAAHLDLYHIITILLANGSNPNVKSERGETALDLAIKGKHDRTAHILHNAGAEFVLTLSSTTGSAKSKLQWLTTTVPLIYSVISGNTNILQKLLDEGANIETVDEQGNTLLIIAAKEGNLEIVKLLTDRGAKVNSTSPGGWTALTKAAEAGYSEIVAVLLSCGANPLATSKGGYTALSLATLRGRLPIVKMLAENADAAKTELDYETALSMASKHNQVEIAHFIESKIKPNSKQT